MSGRRRRDPKRNVVKPQMEKLEARWLLSQAEAIAGSRRIRDVLAAEIDRVGGPLGQALSTDFARWAAHHPDQAQSAVAALESFEARKLTQGGLGAWGRLRLLVQMEGQGDHRFDGLYGRLSTRFSRWSANHPAQAALSGVNLPSTSVPVAGASAVVPGPGAGAATAVPGAGGPAAGGSGNGAPPHNIGDDTYVQYGYCCFPTVGGLAGSPNSPNGVLLGGAPGGAGSSGGSGGAGLSGGAAGNASSSGPDGLPRNVSAPTGAAPSGVEILDSDVNLITGEYLQDHQLAAYQSLGQLSGIDLQYSSLQAYPEPVVTGTWTVNTNGGATTFSSSTITANVNGHSQGSPITITGGPYNGTYVVNVQAVTETSTPTGILPVTLTMTKNLTGGGTSTDNFSASLMLVNASSSPYGAGWSIGGLQQITVGSSGSTLMITDGTDAPEEFTSSNGVNYTGFTTDTSTLTYSASSHTYTRAYHDGTTVVFNSYGQETSTTDPNGNTTSYSYTGTSGALHTITDPVGLITTLAYDSYGHLNTVTDPAGRVTTFTFDSSGNLTAIEDPTTATTTYGYSSTHEMTSETNPDSKTATVTYDSFSRMSSELLFDGTSTTSIKPAQEQGLTSWGSTISSLPTTMAYDATFTDPNGATTTITLDQFGGIISEVDGNGNTTTITRNANDWPTSVKDPMGRVTTYTYDSSGDITQITQPDNANEYLTYSDSLGVPTEIEDFNGNTTTFVLDSHGNVTEEMLPTGVNEQWTYNSAGLPLTYTDGNGKTTTLAYDSYDRLATVTEPLTGSPTIQYGYNAAGDVTSVTDEVGDTTTYTYDGMGRLLTEQDPVQAAAGKDTAYTYDSAGNLVAITDANGHTTTYTYNARNQPITVTDAVNDVTTYIYDAEGNETGIIDPLGNRSTYTYDNDNNLLTAQDALGTTTYTYDYDDERISATDPNGHTTTYSYNSLGEVSAVTLSGLTTPTYYTYDEDGNLRTVTDQNGHTVTYTYDKIGEETAVTDGNGHTTSYSYNGDGNVLTVTDPLSHITTYSYDPMGDLLTETDPTGGGTTTYTYDSAGDLLTVTDPDSNTTTYTYNAAHELATQTSPTGGITTYTYDLVGNLTQTVDPDGHEIQYGYDAANRETTETWVNPLGGSFDVVTYTYDGDGELTKVSDNNATYEYTYNAEHEVTSQADVGSANLPTVTLTYNYDPAGNETSLTDSLGGVVSYTYDARDELTNQTFSGTGLSAEAVSYTYDPTGNLTGLTRYSNLAETTVVASTTIAYDAASEVAGITDKNSGGTTLVSYGYTYDAAGRVTQEVRNWNSGSSTDTLTYGYTNNNQLTSVSHTNGSFSNESFTWDANGNQTGTGYTTTTGNEQTASPGYTYTYDADGSMITATQTSTGDVWTYSYDFRNRMTGAVEKTSGGTVLAQVTYTYDALDNRIGMDENGTQTWTLFDGSTPVMDFSSSSTSSLTMRYLWGPMGIVARQTSGGTVSWYLSDRLGTVRDLINNSGSIIDHVDYSAFGTVLDESSPTSGDRMMGFAGMERDMVTGQNLAVERIENPGTGRWDGQDPLGFAAADANLYRYVANEPTVYLDPTGLQETWIHGPKLKRHEVLDRWYTFDVHGGIKLDRTVYIYRTDISIIDAKGNMLPWGNNFFHCYNREHSYVWQISSVLSVSDFIDKNGNLADGWIVVVYYPVQWVPTPVGPLPIQLPPVVTRRRTQPPERGPF